MITWWKRRQARLIAMAEVLIVDALATGGLMTAWELRDRTPFRVIFTFRALTALMARGVVVDAWVQTDAGLPKRRFYRLAEAR